MTELEAIKKGSRSIENCINRECIKVANLVERAVVQNSTFD